MEAKINFKATVHSVMLAAAFILCTIAQAEPVTTTTYYHSDALGSIVSASDEQGNICLLYTSPSPRDKRQSRMPSSA